MLRSDEILGENYAAVAPSSSRLALTGNFWRKAIFKKFCDFIGRTGVQLDWFGRGPSAPWLEADPERLARTGIHCIGFLSGLDFVSRLRGYPVMVVPSRSLDSEDGNLSFSHFSLRSRLVFGLTQARIPILVLGHPETAAGRFVRQLGIGGLSPYDAERLQFTVAKMLNRDRSEISEDDVWRYPNTS